MTSKASYPKVSYDASKAEEFSALIAFRDSVADGTYIAGLLNKRLLDWFQQQMKDDFTCDLFELFEDEKQKKWEAQDDARKTGETAKLFEQQLNEQTLFSNRLGQKLVAERERANKAERELSNAKYDFYEERTALEDKLAAKDDEIMRLKAKLFDARA